MVSEEHTTPNWHFAQCFGDKGDVEDITEADIISTVEFDHTGDYLATGDKGGRVVLFERFEGKKGCEYKFYNEFQSHEPEFDYLKSLEIEEKINKIKWCRRQNAAHFLLSTNDKTIKLWKVYEKNIKMVAENNLNDHNIIRQSPNLASLSSGTFSSSTTNNGVINSGSLPHFTPQTLRLPRMTHHETIVTATPRRIFQNAHAYHINSISVNSDAETFISADDLRINLWNLNIPDQSFNIVDIKPVNMEELTEVITAAEFHPVHCNYFAYSSSKGTIKLADMRESALCDHHAKLFEVEEDPGTKSFFSEIISSVCDIRFSRDGRYILSRDFLTLKIWDLAMDGRTPLQQINIHDHLRHKLCDLYESDCIFDKFECTFSGDGKHALTGSYNNNFMIYPTAIGAQHSPGNAGTGGEILLQADKSAFKAKKSLAQQKKAAAARGASPARGGRATPPPSALSRASALDVDSMDFNKKILHLSWHPHEDTVAIAATNNVLPQSSFFSMDFVLMVAFPVLCNNTIICVDYHPSINRTAFHSHFLVTCVKFLGLFGLFRQIGFVGAGPFIG